MISVADAHRAIAAALWPPPRETVAFDGASGRVLAQAVTAPFAQPRFDNSAMDGYAVRAVDTAAASPDRPVHLRVAGTAAAGAPFSGEVGPNSCAQVMTGGQLPRGADAVVMVEHTSGFSGPQVTIFKAVTAGDNIRRCGEEIAAGSRLLTPGAVLSPAEIGIVASFGQATLSVFRRPRVVIFATGNELRSPGEQLAAGEIYNSNLPALAQLAACYGADVVDCRVVRDDPAELRAFIDQALPQADVIVSSGGVSMGRFDYVRDVVTGAGLEQRFWKVAQKPGRPLLFASGDRRVLFGLPGNPVSALVCFVEYVAPALRRLQGANPDSKLRAALTAEFPCELDKQRFLLGRLFQTCATTLSAEPTAKRGSHMLTSAAGANCLLEASPGARPLPVGAEITATLLPWAAIAVRRGAGLPAAEATSVEP